MATTATTTQDTGLVIDLRTNDIYSQDLRADEWDHVDTKIENRWGRLIVAASFTRYALGYAYNIAVVAGVIKIITTVLSW